MLSRRRFGLLLAFYVMEDFDLNIMLSNKWYERKFKNEKCSPVEIVRGG